MVLLTLKMKMTRSWQAIPVWQEVGRFDQGGQTLVLRQGGSLARLCEDGPSLKTACSYWGSATCILRPDLMCFFIIICFYFLSF